MTLGRGDNISATLLPFFTFVAAVLGRLVHVNVSKFLLVAGFYCSEGVKQPLGVLFVVPLCSLL